MNRKLLKESKKIIYKIIKNYNGHVIQKCTNFKNFTGRDIDCIYLKKKLNPQYKNTITINREFDNLRLYINQSKNIDYLSLDIEELSTIPKNIREIYTKRFNQKVLCKKTKLSHLDNKSIIFLKLYKYFFITINSFDQLHSLKKEIKKLNKKDFSLIMNSIDKAFTNEAPIIKKFIS